MRIAPLLALAAALAASGCAYWPADTSPLRITSSPAQVSTCRSLGAVGRTRTDGVDYYGLADALDRPPAVSPRRARGGPAGNRFGERLDVLQAEALRRGATDLLLRRVILRDWSYVQAVAYRCRS